MGFFGCATYTGREPKMIPEIEKIIRGFDLSQPKPPQYGSLGTAIASPNKEAMPEVSRPEFEAKLEAMEAKMDARVAAVSGDIKALIAKMEERDKRFETIAENTNRAADQAANLKSSMWLAAISIVASIILASAGFYLAIQANTLSVAQTVTSAFQAGQGSQPAPPVTTPSTSKK